MAERYPGTFTLLGTELAEPGALRRLDKLEAELDEDTNQTRYRLALANGGSLWVNKSLEIVGIDNAGLGAGTEEPVSLESIIAALEAEFGLEGYLRTTSERQDSGLCFLWWEKQVGAFRNPYDSLRVVIDLETMGLERLDRYNFPAETTEPVLTQGEALEIAAPYLGDGPYNSEDLVVELICKRPNLRAGEAGTPELGPTSRLAYVFYRGKVRVAIDAVTGELMGLDEAVSAIEDGLRGE